MIILDINNFKNNKKLYFDCKFPLIFLFTSNLIWHVLSYKRLL